MTFHDRVQQLCTEKGVSITAMAVSLGMSKSVPYNWKNGTAPQSTTVKKVAEYFGLTPTELMNYEGGMTIHTVTDNHGIIGKVEGPAAIAVNMDNDSAPQSGLESELLRIFRKLSVLDQAQLLLKANEMLKGDQ